jgi:cytochrome P450
MMTADVWSNTKYEYFEKYGSIFLIVSPQRNHLLVANAEAIHQITGQLDRFPKDSARYGILKMFGENLLTADVPTWKAHRKLISGSFNEHNAALAFHESIRQSKGMLDIWTGSAANHSEPLRTVERDTLRLALHVISRVGFGVPLLWPGATMPNDASPKLLKYGGHDAPPGHVLSFAQTIHNVAEKILFLAVVPIRILKGLPSRNANQAGDAYDDFNKYMSELMDENIEEQKSGKTVEGGMDLMGQLLRPQHDQGSKSIDEEAVQDGRSLSREEIIGNAFIVLLAGYETSAGVLHFSLVQLAANPASQRRLQKDVDELVGASDPTDWDYERLVNRMMTSMLGACMNESLRTMPPVVDVPKMVTPDQDQTIVVDGNEHVLLKGTSIALLPVSVHHNARYWPTQPSKIQADGTSDIKDFVPERWLQTGEKRQGQEAELFRPPPGSFIPFSAGARSCIGKRIAQVEILAMLAVVFQKYSVELAVDDWATDDEVADMNKEDATAVYGLAQERCRDSLATATTQITLKLQSGRCVPVKLVRRGEERFVNWLDS